MCLSCPLVIRSPKMQFKNKCKQGLCVFAIENNHFLDNHKKVFKKEI